MRVIRHAPSPNEVGKRRDDNVAYREIILPADKDPQNAVKAREGLMDILRIPSPGPDEEEAG